MSKNVYARYPSADERDALSTAMYTLETAANVKYDSHAYMVGCYHSMLIQMLDELPASHTLEFTNRINRYTKSFFSEEK